MIFDQLVKRFHPREDPPESWYITGEPWGASDTGEYVSPESAMNISAVYACVRILSESVASLPLKVYRRRKDGGKDLAYDHPLYELLHKQPNPEMTSFSWREAGMSHCLLWGNSYSQIVTTNGGQVGQLWPLEPDQMDVVRVDGKIHYSLRRPKNGPRDYLGEEVLHIPGLGFNGLVGFSPITMARNSLGLARATERFGSKLFVNGAMPKVALTVPPGVKLSDKARANLKESWEANHQGVINSHKTAVLEDGMDVKVLSVPPEDAQFLETRKFQLQEIARIFRVPPHMLADLDKATFSNIEHQSLEFVVHVLRPWLVRWEQAMNWKLFTTAERAQGYFVEHLVDGLLRGDIKSRYEAYNVGRNGGWLSVNDIRSLENMNPVEGGDEYLRPLNMSVVGDEGDASDARSGEGVGLETRFGAVLNKSNRGDLAQARDLVDGVLKRAEPADEDERARIDGVAAAFRGVLAEVFERACRREQQDVTRLEEKNQPVKGFYDAHISWMSQQLYPVARAMVIALSSDGKVSGERLMAAERACSTLAVNHAVRQQGTQERFEKWDEKPMGLANELVDELLEVE